MPEELSDSIPILLEESHFLLINKPAGLFSQAAGDVDNLEHRLTLQLKQRDAHRGVPFIGLPHRLDRGTSGVMLIAKNQRALKRFGEQFQSRKVRKFYLAVVEGDVPEGEMQWVDFVRKIPNLPQAEAVGSETPGARRALASAECLEREMGLSLLRVQLQTGRMHQIRVQSASRGFPVLGDVAYGSRQAMRTTSWMTDQHAHPPLALHALTIEFRHPQTAIQMSVTAPVPDTWNDLPSRLAQRATSFGNR